MWWDENLTAVNHRPLSEKDFRTILVFAENDMKIQATADAMNRHYNAIAWRIARINAITGLDPRKFYDLIKLVDMVNSGLEGAEDV